MTDSRQRAPYAHTSSSSDLTAIHNGSRQLNGRVRASPWPESFNPETSTGGPLTHLDSLVPLLGSHPDRLAVPTLQSHRYMSNHLAAPVADHFVPFRRPRGMSHPTSRPSSPMPHPFAVPKLAFPAYDTVRFVTLCSLWYSSSAVSSNTTKVILNNFHYPVTLTIVQFSFAAGLALACSRPEVGLTSRIRWPTPIIIRSTLPMAAFQVGGHICSSLAIGRVPVSTVHTIKVSHFR